MIRSVDGLGIYDRMGASVANAGDVNNDGLPDLIIGAPEDFQIFFNGPGFARVISGANGSVLRTFSGDAAGDLFGYAVAGVGDLNGDGYDDVAVGAPYAVAPQDILSGGMVRVFSGIDGSVMWSVYGNEDDELGYSVAGAGDVDDDGVLDVIAGAPRADVGAISSAGHARVLSGVDGSLIHQIEGTAGNQRLGYSVAGLGNVNAADIVVAGTPPAPVPDTFDDVVVGSLFGGAKIYSGHDKSVLATFNSGSSDDIYGRTVASIADLNGDGVRDVVIAATEEDFFNPGPGYVEVRSGRKGTGNLLLTLNGVDDGERFGFSLDDGGDWDGDGKHDILVGTAPNITSIPSYAAMFSGANGSLMFTIDSLDVNEHAGFSVAGLGDGDGDGRNEIAVGVPEAQPVGLGSGTVRVYESPFQVCGAVTSYCPATVNSSGGAAVLQNLGSTSVGDNDVLLFVTGLPQPAGNPPTGNPGIFFYGNNQTSVPFGAGTLCVAGPFIKRLQMVPAQVGGFAAYSLDITAETAPEYQITPGSTWFFQYWFRDPAGGNGPNFSNALEMSFCE
ncbi:MAG: VCBS repeat-containing protein [Planctomycetes bacterium]|nr:VCBS repeat-containing protein [Planctomycetota bacterium]